jgi:RNA polymerase sigma-70 factor (ECF subfamily)
MRVLRYDRTLSGVRDQRTWLASIAWRVAVERRRKKSEAVPQDVGDVAGNLGGHGAAADETLLGAEMSALLERLIATLPRKLRDPLTLSTVKEMSPSEVAQVLGINEAAVRSRVFRARQVLREKLGSLLEGKHGA